MANGAEVGSAHISIFPVMTGFKSALSKEIKSSGNEGSSIFNRSFSGVGSKTGKKLGSDLKAAFTGSAGNFATPGLKKLQAEVASASRAMVNARLKQQDAAGRVTVAEARLADAVKRGGEGSVQAIAAGEALSSAKRREASASENLTAVEKRLKDAKDSLTSSSEKTTGAINRIKNSFTALGRASKPALKSVVNGVGDAAVAISNKVSGVLKVGFTAAGGLAVAGLGIALTKGFSRLNALDQAKAKLSGLGNDAEQVNAILRDSLASVKGTAFGLDEAATVAASAVAAGIKPGDQLQNTLKTVANVAAAAGGSMSDMGAIFNKVAASGKADTEDIKQLANQGIPIWQALSKQIGKPVSDVQELAKKGKISFDMFQQAAASAAGNVASAMGGTLTGSLKNMWASVGRIGANLEQGIFPKIAPLIQAVTKALEPLESKASDLGAIIGSKLSPKIDDFAGKVGQLPDLIDKVMSKSGRADILKSLGFDKGSLSGLKTAFDGIKAGAKTIGDAFVGVSNASYDAGRKMPLATKATEAMTKSLQLVQPLLPAVAELIKLFGKMPVGAQSAVIGLTLFGGQLKPLMTPISILVSGTRSLLSAVGKAGGAIHDFLANKLSNATPIAKLAQQMDSASDSVSNLGKKAEDSGEKVAGASKSFGGLSAASLIVGVAAAGISGYLMMTQDQASKTKAITDGLAESMKSGASSVANFWRELQSGKTGELGAVSKLSSFGKDKNLADLVKDTGTSWSTVKDAINGSSEAMKKLNDAAGSGITINGTYKAKMQEVRDVVNGLRDSYKDTIKDMIAYSQTQEAISNGSAAVQSAFSELSTTLKANGDNLENNSTLTKQSQDAVDKATTALWNNVQAQLEYGKKTGDMDTATQKAKNSVQQMRDSLISTLQQQGMSEDAAKSYADTLGLIPSRVGTEFTADTALSKAQVEAYVSTIAQTPEQKNIVMNALTAQANGDIANLHLNMDNLPTIVRSLLLADNTDALNKTGTARAVLDSFGAAYANAKVDAIDNASPKVNSVLDGLKNINNGSWTAKLNFSEGGSAHRANGGEVRRANGGSVQRLAGGGISGYVRGPGTTTSDSIPTLLSDREYVIRAAAAKKIGLDALDRANRTGELNGSITASQQVVQEFHLNFNIPETNPKLLAEDVMSRLVRAGAGGVL